mgnify:FL=1
MDIKKIIVGLSVVLISLSIFADHHRGGMKSMAAVAESWVKAQYTSKEKTLAVVKNHMAEDGVSFSGRFVGFGFNWDPENEEGMIVTRVIPGSPSEGVLEVGDKFVSVKGVKVTEDNINTGKLSFSGLPGEPVDAVVMRNNKRVKVSVTRGIVNPTWSKDQVLENIESADAEEWASNLVDYQIGDVVVDRGKNIAYVWHWSKSKDEVSGKEVESHNFTRMRFNENGMVQGYWSLSEEELVLRQTGWTITR